MSLTDDQLITFIKRKSLTEIQKERPFLYKVGKIIGEKERAEALSKDTTKKEVSK